MVRKFLVFRGNTFTILTLFLAGIIVCGGCHKPIDTTPSHTQKLNPDEDDGMGGSFLESSDIRTMAQEICGKVLSLPEITNAPGVVRIATGKIKNSTRYMIDTSLLLKRLRLDLNRHAQGKLRFYAQGVGQRTRTRILTERQQSLALQAIDKAAMYIAKSDTVQKAAKPIRVAVTPVANTNLFNMNANSFASLMRAKIKEYAGSKVLFARPGSNAEVDYTLTGEFIAQSIKEEGIANTVKDLKWAQQHPKQWQGNNNNNNANKSQNTVNGVQVNINNQNRRRVRIGPNTVYRAIDPALWNSPNVTKTFNVMLVNKDDMAVLEKSINLEKQIKSGQENANYILTGEISDLSKASAGRRSDYVLVSYYLVDPVTNEMVMEYGYEVKRVTSRSVLYR